MRARILDATIELVAKRGVEVPYEQVAEASGVHKTTIYRNFPSRDELIRDAPVAYAERIAPLTDSGDVRADLVEFVLSLAKSLQTPIGQAVLKATHLVSPDYRRLRRLVRDVVWRRVAILQTRLNRAVDDNQLPAVDAALLGEMLCGSVHYRVSMMRQPVGRADAERITDVVLAGIWAVSSKGK